MYPDLQTDLYNLDSVKYLRHSAKGSLDAYDVTHSLTDIWIRLPRDKMAWIMV